MRQVDLKFSCLNSSILPIVFKSWFHTNAFAERFDFRAVVAELYHPVDFITSYSSVAMKLCLALSLGFLCSGSFTVVREMFDRLSFGKHAPRKPPNSTVSILACGCSAVDSVRGKRLLCTERTSHSDVTSLTLTKAVLSSLKGGVH